MAPTGGRAATPGSGAQLAPPPRLCDRRHRRPPPAERTTPRYSLVTLVGGMAMLMAGKAAGGA